MTEQTELIERLRQADRNSVQSIAGSRIFGEAAEHIEAQNARIASQAAEIERLLAERQTLMHNKRINEACQTAIERGEIWLSCDGYWHARKALEAKQ